MKKILLLFTFFLFQTLSLFFTFSDTQGLADPEDLKKELSKLEQKHGKEKVERAIQVASIVSEENNLKTIQALMDPEDKYGQSVVDEAAKKISGKNLDSRVPRMQARVIKRRG